MKKLFVVSILTLAIIAIAEGASFAASQDITITATVSGVQGVSLSATSWAIGNINTGESRDSTAITATNTGSSPETLKLSAASTGDFTLNGVAGADKIAIWGKCASADPGLAAANALTGTPGQTSATVSPTGSMTVYLRYFSPTSIASGKSDGGSTVTVSTAAP